MGSGILYFVYFSTWYLKNRCSYDHQTWHRHSPPRVLEIGLFWGQKVKGHDRGTKIVPSWVTALLYVLLLVTAWFIVEFSALVAGVTSSEGFSVLTMLMTTMMMMMVMMMLWRRCRVDIAADVPCWVRRDRLRLGRHQRPSRRRPSTRRPRSASTDRRRTNQHHRVLPQDPAPRRRRPGQVGLPSSPQRTSSGRGAETAESGGGGQGPGGRRAAQRADGDGPGSPAAGPARRGGAAVRRRWRGGQGQELGADADRCGGEDRVWWGQQQPSNGQRHVGVRFTRRRRRWHAPSRTHCRRTAASHRSSQISAAALDSTRQLNNVRPMSHLQFCRATLSRDKITW